MSGGRARVGRGAGGDVPGGDGRGNPAGALGSPAGLGTDAGTMGRRIAGLSPDKQDLLRRLLGASQGAAGGPPPVRPRRAQAGETVPVSFAQQRLWLVDQLQPGHPAYIVQSRCEQPPALDVAALAASLNEIVRRHEALRTTFRPVDGQPVQVIAPALRLHLPVVDLRRLAPRRAPAEMARLAERDAERGFDLARGPLLRTMLLLRPAATPLLALTLHHIVTDGWSMRRLLAEQEALYAAGSRGLPSPLPALPVQYGDFANWQREWLQGEVLAEQLAYWRGQLADLPTLELPTDRPRPQSPSFRGARELLSATPAAAGALRTLAAAHGATLFMVLLGAFQVLLSRHSGQLDLAVGSPVANRSRTELEPLIGFFVNTLVLRLDLAGEPSFVQVIERVKAAAISAFAHQDLPFEKLVEELQPARDLSRNPLVQVMFQLHNLDETPTRETGRVATAFDLTLDLWATPDRLDGQLDYATDLFGAATIARLAGHFRALLDAIAAAPARPVSELSLLTAGERAQLAAWNRTAAPLPAGLCVHHLVERQAEREPGALAVVGGEAVEDGTKGRAGGGIGGDETGGDSNVETLTYGELDRRAARVARRLLAAGIRPAALVAVCLERSPRLPVAWLGAWKAGGAFLALDAADPPARLAQLLAESGAAALLTERRLLARLPDDRPATFCLDDLDEADARAGEDASRGAPTAPLRAIAADPRQLAYVIYTSGSTGTPKGVELSHEGLLNLVLWHQRTYGVTAADRATSLAALGFDAAVWEVWPYLAAGASLHLVPDAVRTSPPDLAAWLARRAITLCFLPTPLAEAALAEPWPEGPAPRLLLTGGDRLHPLPEKPLRFQVVNHYGPTEATVVATAGAPLIATGTQGRDGNNEQGTARDAAPYTDRASASPPPIGLPIANARAHVLDRQGQPLPVGIPGELHLAGRGLARGYRGRPDLTAERFLPDPWSDEPGGRLYRTGDRVRRLPSGQLDFLGRVDDQLKLRGYRIEPGEIEAILRRQPGVRDCVVALEKTAAGLPRLVAYLVAEDAAAPPRPDDLRSALQVALPDPMVPGAFVVLPVLPLTARGKVDRARLPAPTGPPEEASHTAAPRTPTEERLAASWSELLGVERVGLDDDFFGLGGHSLLATRLLSRVRDTFAVELPLRLFFNAPTLGALTRAIEEELRRPHLPPAPPIAPLPRHLYRIAIGSEADLRLPEALRRGASGESPLQ